MKKYQVVLSAAFIGCALLLGGCQGDSKPAATTAPAKTETAAEKPEAEESMEINTFVGEAGVEENGSYQSLSEGQTGWEEDRDKVAKSFKTSGKKAPGDNFVRAKAESVVALVNNERAKQGLGALILDESIMAAAETRAQEQKAMFSHTRPNGSNCFTVFDEYSIPANYRGENVGCGGACTPEQIMKAWMDSPGHRENIMSDKFGRIGVGCFESGGYGYWAQEFAN